MILWTTQEENELANTILDHLRRGLTIDDAYIVVSKKINRTFDAIRKYWNTTLRPRHKKDLDFIRSTVKTNNDYAGSFTTNEDDKLMNIMINCIASNETKSSGYLTAAKGLCRSYSSCRSRWHDYLLPRNKTYIEQQIKLLVEEKQKMKSPSLQRTWSKEDENIAVSIALNTLKSGDMMKNAFVAIGNRIGKNNKVVENYWYTFLRKENEAAVLEAKQSGINPSAPKFEKKSYEPDDLKLQIYTQITDRTEAGVGITKAIEQAAAALGRTKGEVHIVWYRQVRNDENLKKQYETNKANTPNHIKEKYLGNVQIGFTDEQDKLILQFVLESVKAGTSIALAFQKATKHMSHKLPDIETRWRKVLQYKFATELKNGYTADEVVEEEVTGPVEEAIEEVAEEEAMQEVADDQGPQLEIKETKIITPQILTIEKMSEFVFSMQALIEENKILKRQIGDLKEKVAKMDEIEEKNKQLMEAVESARKFLNMSIGTVVTLQQEA